MPLANCCKFYILELDILKPDMTHIPVLAKETIDALDLSPGDVVVDATLGAGGHSLLVSEKISPGGVIIGIDKDKYAIQTATNNLHSAARNIRFLAVHDSYFNLDRIIQSSGYDRVDAILFDLGLSSLQLDDATRGFSFLKNAPLDMRFNSDQELTAYEIANGYSKEELATILWEWGEERASRRIAQAIFDARKKAKIETTFQLSAIVAMAKGGRHGKIHPATQTFQALRIAVNHELAELTGVLPKAIERLKVGGRLAVISFHSLEDRIVKNIFKEAKNRKIVSLINKKPIVADRSEILDNPRSRSAKLRVIEKIS